MVNLTKHFDSWSSIVMGFGDVLRDKIETMLPGRIDGTPDYRQLREQFESDDITSNVVSKPVDEIFRVGYEVETEDPELDKSIRDYAATVGLDTVLADAMTFARLFGGAAVYVVVDDGREQWEPMAPRIRQLIGFQLLTPEQLMGNEYDTDPTSMTYDKAISYRFVGERSSVIHASRLIIFDGVRVSDQRRKELNGWGISVAKKLNTPIRAYHLAYSSSSSLMADASQGVFKIKGLMEMIAGGNEAVVLSRMKINDQTRSSMRALIMDADNESFERVSSQLGGIPEMMAKFENRLSSASQIPVTILFGTSPGGLNATGESDTRHFYDSLAAAREKTLKPALEQLYKVILTAPNGPTNGREPEKWDIEFEEFYEPTEKETAEVRKIYCDIDVAYVNAGILAPQEVAISRFGGGEWSTDMKIETEFRSEPTNGADITEPDQTTSPTVPEPATEEANA